MHDWRRLAVNWRTQRTLPRVLSLVAVVVVVVVVAVAVGLKFNFYGFRLKISLNPSLLML
jgi:hypothetical protein